MPYESNVDDIKTNLSELKQDAIKFITNFSLTKCKTTVGSFYDLNAVILCCYFSF